MESSFEDNAKNLEFPILLTVEEDSGNLPVAVRAEQFSDGDGESDDEQELYLQHPLNKLDDVDDIEEGNQTEEGLAMKFLLYIFFFSISAKHPTTL